MGTHRKNRILLALFLAAFFLSAISIWSWFDARLPTKTIEDLYAALDWALWLVIIGVVIEEWKLIWHIGKFIRYTWRGKFWCATLKAWEHKGEIAEGLGFIILVVGLAAELAIDPSIEGAQKAIEAKDNDKIVTAQGVAADAIKQAGKLGVNFNNLHEYVTAQVTRAGQDMTDLKALEHRIDKAVNGANEKTAAVESRTSALVEATSPRELEQ
jgi:uncharacterized membrane protein